MKKDKQCKCGETDQDRFSRGCSQCKKCRAQAMSKDYDSRKDYEAVGENARRFWPAPDQGHREYWSFMTPE